MAKARMLPAYTTRLGRAFWATPSTCSRPFPRNPISLVFTSPPFALRRQKAYGNVAATEYIDWFWPIAEEIQRVLRQDGSFVMELGGAWNPGSGDAFAVPLRAAGQARRSVPPRPGLLLVQPVAAADAGRMGHDPPHARQGGGHADLVAVEDDGAAGRQSPRARTLQQVDEAAAQGRLQDGDAAVAARDRPALPEGQRRRHPAEHPDGAEHALVR